MCIGDAVLATLRISTDPAVQAVGELTLRGCYLGSNVTYNVKKLVEQGYLA
jgi:DNA-binding MarR family transcriptional regulator